MMGLLSRVSWWSNGGPSVGLEEGFHCGINLRRQPAAQAGPRRWAAVSPPDRPTDRPPLTGFQLRTQPRRRHGHHEPLLLLTGKTFDLVHLREPSVSPERRSFNSLLWVSTLLAAVFCTQSYLLSFCPPSLIFAPVPDDSQRYAV